MYIGQSVLIKNNGRIQEGKIEIIYDENLDIRLLDDTLITRKFWEIHKMEIKDDL